MDRRERDHMERIALHSKLERELEIVEQYEVGLAFRHDRIGKIKYRIGRLDERLKS